MHQHPGFLYLSSGFNFRKAYIYINTENPGKVQVPNLVGAPVGVAWRRRALKTSLAPRHSLSVRQRAPVQPRPEARVQQLPSVSRLPPQNCARAHKNNMSTSHGQHVEISRGLINNLFSRRWRYFFNNCYALVPATYLISSMVLSVMTFMSRAR